MALRDVSLNNPRQHKRLLGLVRDMDFVQFVQKKSWLGFLYLLGLAVT